MKIGSVVRPPLVVALLLAWAPTALAEDLEGRLFLGDGLSIEMELKEGLFSEFLRYLKLKDSPRQVVNLSTLGRAGDHLFIGDDLKLYVASEKDEGAAYPVGTASTLWSMRLDDDVELRKVAELSKILEPSGGQVGRMLRVRLGKSRPRAHTVQQASFEFWLRELVFEYDRYDPHRKVDENYPYIVEAIRTALPRDGSPSRDQTANLTFLDRYVRSADAMDLIPLRKLLADLIADLGRADAGTELLDRYRAVEATVLKRTEGL